MMDFRDTEGTGENMATDAIEAATQAMANVAANVAKAKPAERDSKSVAP
ncbi:MAG: hypothetical protein JWO16_814, partial [Sphingomonas bacterium]|nr:hypothetical protein [Sphingomonas bacterium]